MHPLLRCCAHSPPAAGLPPLTAHSHCPLPLPTPLVRLPASHGVLVTDPRLARKLLEGVSHTGLGIGLATRGVGQPHRVRVRVGVNTGLGLGVATQGVSHTGL